MELRTRILPRMLNSEVEAYLEENDIIIVPVGTVGLQWPGINRTSVFLCRCNGNRPRYSAGFYPPGN